MPIEMIPYALKAGERCEICKGTEETPYLTHKITLLTGKDLHCIPFHESCFKSWALTKYPLTCPGCTRDISPDGILSLKEQRAVKVRKYLPFVFGMISGLPVAFMHKDYVSSVFLAVGAHMVCMSLFLPYVRETGGGGLYQLGAVFTIVPLYSLK